MDLNATLEIPTLDLLEKIVMDDKYFHEFSNNKDSEIYDFEKKELLSHLKEYLRNKLAGDVTEKFFERAKYLNDKFNLDIPKLRNLSDGIDPKFYEYIMQGVDALNDPVSKARLIYLNLAKVLCYDEHVPAYHQNANNPVVDDVYYKKTSSVNLSNPNVSCNLWSRLYSEFLKTIGIDAKVVTKGRHKFVGFNLDGVNYTADATNSFLDQENIYLNDLTRVKLGGHTVGFLGYDKNIDKDLGYNSKTLSELYHDYANNHYALSNMRVTSGNPEIDLITSKLDYLSTMAMQLPQIEAVGYLKQMVYQENSIVTKEEVASIMPRHIRLVDENNLVYTSILFAIPNGDEFIYKLLHIPEGLITVSKGYFENLIKENKMLDDGNIPGISQLKR